MVQRLTRVIFAKPTGSAALRAIRLVLEHAAFCVGPPQRQMAVHEAAATVTEFAALEEDGFPPISVGLALKADLARHRRAITRAEELEEELRSRRCHGGGGGQSSVTVGRCLEAPPATMARDAVFNPYQNQSIRCFHREMSAAT